MYDKLDPEMEALKKRKELKIKIELEPEEAMESEEDEMAYEGKDEETAEIEKAMLGPDEAEMVMKEFEKRAPRSLAERVKLDMAKKALEKA